MRKPAFQLVARALAIAVAFFASAATSSAQARDARDYGDEAQADEGYSEPDEDPAPGAYQREEPDYAPRPPAQGTFVGRRFGPRDDEDADDAPPGAAHRGYRSEPVERQDLPPPVTRLAPIPVVPPPPGVRAPRPQWLSEPGWGADSYRDPPPRPPHLRVYAPPPQKDRPHKVPTSTSARVPRAAHGVATPPARSATKAAPEISRREAAIPVRTSATKTPEPIPASLPDSPAVHRHRESQTRENAAASAGARGAEAEIVNKAEPKLNLEKQ